MTDIRRTLLWGIFLASLFFIWEAWNRHNGHPPLFGAPPARVTAPSTGPAPPPAPNTALGVPSLPATPTSGAAVSPVIAAAAPAPAASAAIASQQVTVTTDLVRATIDSVGGTLVRLELLQQAESVGSKEHVVLFDSSPTRLYLAETGLVPPQGGGGLPNHHTPMRILPGERSLASGANELKVVLESDAVGGVKLVKTYTFHRGDYVIDVQQRVENVGTVPINPRIYLQLVRDGGSVRPCHRRYRP